MRKITLLLISIATSVLLASCGAIFSSTMSNSQISEKKGSIPPDFGVEKSTTLFITHGEKYNKKLKKYINESFQGNYEFVTETDLLTDIDNYTNSKKYKYMFDRELISHYSNGVSNTSYKFYIKNIQTGKIYTTKLHSSSYGPIIKVYIKKLNEKWLQNNK